MIRAFHSAVDLAKQIRDREISSLELTEYFIGRIGRFDAKVNAVVVHNFEQARHAAKLADEALNRGDEIGPLHGLPMTIKEAYDIAGLPTTWGVPKYKENIATRDADSVVKYKAAGAHFLGKTNVPFRLFDAQSYNENYGTTSNPWDTRRIPGGSSGGSAAALAAGLTALESGSDIGGSIRNPAHFCGVYGHKPTWGIVPTDGHSLPGDFASPDLAVVGPMARSANDLAIALDILAGPGPLDRRGWRISLPRPTKKGLSEYRVAIWQNHDHAPVSLEIADRVQEVGDRLAQLGATVSDSARPDIDVEEAIRTYLSLLTTGSGASDEEFGEELQVANGLVPGDSSDDSVLKRGKVQPHRDWLRQNNHRSRLRSIWNQFFNDWDLVIAPITPTTAFEHDHSPPDARTISVDKVDQPYISQIFWPGFFTLAYLPSTAFPTGLSKQGLPIGLQAVGAEYTDHTCIEFARLLANEIRGFVPPIGYDD